MSLPLHRELREPAAAAAWLAAGLCLARLPAPVADEGRVATWLLAILAERGVLPPAGAVADIGQLLCGHTASVLAGLPVPPGELADAVRAYEEHVIGRLETDPRLDAIIEAIARLPDPDADRAIALVTAHLVDRMGPGAGVSVSPGAVRRLMRVPADELGAQGYAALSRDQELAALIAAG